jgi:hypothetical protein
VSAGHIPASGHVSCSTNVDCYLRKLEPVLLKMHAAPAYILHVQPPVSALKPWVVVTTGGSCPAQQCYNLNMCQQLKLLSRLAYMCPKGRTSPYSTVRNHHTLLYSIMSRHLDAQLDSSIYGSYIGRNTLMKYQQWRYSR